MQKPNWLIFMQGLYKENPILVHMIGLCPVLAVTTQTINGITMGLCILVVLLGSNIIISLFKDFIPGNLRIPAYIVIIAAFVTLLKIYLEAFFPQINEALGIYIPLIVANCLPLARAELFASKNTVSQSIIDAFGHGLGYTAALTLISLIREVLGAGQITLKVADWGTVINLETIYQFFGLVNSIGDKAPLLIFILPPGGFIVVGLLMGSMNFLRREIKKRILVIKRKKLLLENPELQKLEENIR